MYKFKVSLFPMVVALALAACATAPTSEPSLAAADYAAILSDPLRTEADKKDDAARKPAEVLAFAGVRPGATILEMEVGRGWYTEILSAAVGPAGKIITQNPSEFAYSSPALATRRAAGRLPNVVETTTHFDHTLLLIISGLPYELCNRTASEYPRFARSGSLNLHIVRRFE